MIQYRPSPSEHSSLCTKDLSFCCGQGDQLLDAQHWEAQHDAGISLRKRQTQCRDVLTDVPVILTARMMNPWNNRLVS